MKALCQLAELGPAMALEVDVADGTALVLLCADGPRAYRNSCPHQGRSMNFAPGEFLFTPGQQLVCPHHGATFDPSTGQCIEGPCRGSYLQRLTVQVRGEDVFLAAEPD
jgi:nitrite reductase/ring-hydroxylating ferredoxin subunit